MRKILLVVAGLMAVAFIIFSLAELENILDTLQKSNPVFLLAAFLLEGICLYNNSATFGALFRLVGLTEDRWQLLWLTTAANFVNVIAPTAGIGGMAVFLDSARRRGISSGRVTVAGVLYLLYEYASLFCVLALGIVVLIRRNNLSAGELVAAGILLLIALGVGTILYLGYRSPERLGKTLAWLARLVNRLLWPFLHRDYLREQDAYMFSREAAEGIAMLRASRKNLLWPFLFTLNNKALLLAVLAFTFLALDTPFTVGTLVGGFSIGYLFVYVSPTPSGIGVVEGVMPLALSTLRVPFTEAVLITLVYRAVTLWFPLAVGALAFRSVHKEPAGANGEG